MPTDFTQEEEYFDGLLIEGSPFTILQHVSRILASGAHFQYVDGNVIEVIRPGKEEEKEKAVVPSKAEPKVEAVEIAETVTATSEPTIDVGEPTTENEETPSVEAPAPKTRTRKPKTVVAEEAPVEAPGLIDAPPVEEVSTPNPTEVEEN